MRLSRRDPEDARAEAPAPDHSIRADHPSMHRLGVRERGPVRRHRASRTPVQLDERSAMSCTGWAPIFLDSSTVKKRGFSTDPPDHRRLRVLAEREERRGLVEAQLKRPRIGRRDRS
jgi:hypothetical protein